MLQYQLTIVSNLLANATNTILADIALINNTALTNGGTNYSFVALSTTNITSWLSVTNWGYFGSAWGHQPVQRRLNLGAE